MTEPHGCDMTLALAACARGDRSALRRIMDAEGSRLLGVATRMLRRRDLAEEAVQDAMVQIWRKAGQFRAGQGSARGWVFAILRNRCLNILRDGARLSHVDGDTLQDLQDGRQMAAGQAWDTLGPMALRDCLGTLDGSSRHAILLAYVGGYSHGEIAALQAVPLGTCKSKIRRGLETLRGCLS
ncbi:sigma-70 family RNA polymerase sigma factor [Falsirhodobacter halotolerans]|uniref:sigma-70 family RNA polymerase sigma factor n=1 Tax=Falsirhodobacter halotolerans TaxID=1146892 RepID=UPI001FD41376|nr:sigma-70 family RNA polymerase sigma factor [Falsirhodobacter halotolerans]MCJ8141189.1 sigma-70 family RNA polymerase sigma factor [Falsirhodobacter halotolerans]